MDTNPKQKTVNRMMQYQNVLMEYSATDIHLSPWLAKEFRKILLINKPKALEYRNPRFFPTYQREYT